MVREFGLEDIGETAGIYKVEFVSVLLPVLELLETLHI